MTRNITFKILFGLVILSTFITIIIICRNVLADDPDQYIWDNEADNYNILSYQNHYFAQRFMPSATGILDRVLSRTKLIMSTDDTWSAICMSFSIYRKLSESNNLQNPLIQINPLYPKPVQYPNKEWYMIDFDDIHIIPEENYYIICNSLTSNTPFLYWWFGIDTPYIRGEKWTAPEMTGPWTPHNVQNDNQDMMFCTFRTSMASRTYLSIDPNPHIIHLGRLHKNEQKEVSVTVKNTGQDSGAMYWEIDKDYTPPAWLYFTIEDSYGFLDPNAVQKVFFLVTAPNVGGPQAEEIPFISDCGDLQKVLIDFAVSFEGDISTSTPQNNVLVDQSVQFYGEASGGVEPYTYSWDFGDFTGSYEQNPVHTYYTPDTYLVNLTITDNESNTTNVTYVIQVSNLISNFNSSVSNYSNTHKMIYFNDTSVGLNRITNWSWDFGDRATSFTENTYNQFTNEGDYNITLTICDNQSNVSEYSQRIHIEDDPPIINVVDCIPNSVGYCLNTTISANITDMISGVDTVKVNITYPVDSPIHSINCTMNQTNNNTYEYVFSDTRYKGQYNYTIWTFDKAGNSNLSSNTFNVFYFFGNNKIGTQNRSVEDRITGSYFMIDDYALANNITAYVYGESQFTPTYKCMIYRLDNSARIGTTEEKSRSSTGWVTFNFSDPKPTLMKGTLYALTCWGDDNTSKLYFDRVYPVAFGRADSESYGSPPNYVDWTFYENKLYSIYCSYMPDVTPPKIVNVSHTPDTVGFGYNVTINTNVSDDVSGVNLVKVQISAPNGLSTGNYTMTPVGGNTYRHVFANMWALGQYNYTIWAVDNASNVNSSTGHHFNVSVQAQISIATLQDSYTGNQFINITDPPNPPEDYALVGRGLTWDEYYNAISGCTVLEVSAGPINYQEDNGIWAPINSSLCQLASDHPAYNYGYRIGNDRGLFGVYFKPNIQSDWPVAFTFNRSDDPTMYVIRSKLVGVGYVDPTSNWAYHYLEGVQGSQGQFTGNTATYENVFPGTDVTWSYRNTEMKEEITMDNTTKGVLQSHPPSLYGLNNESSYVIFITKLTHQDLTLYNGSDMLTGNVTVSNACIDFRDALGQFKCALPPGEAYEMNNESMRQKLKYRIVHLNGDTYLFSGLKLSDLSAMTFPVIIDPTLTVHSISNDGYIYNSSTNYNTVRTASTGTVNSSGTSITIGQKKASTIPLPTYYIYRGFLFFNTSSLPSNAYIDNATLSLYKASDLSTTDFQITIQNGQPTYPHIPMQTADYNKNHYAGNGGALNTSGFVNGFNTIYLNSNGKSWLNRTGLTKLCLRSSRDINGNTPTGNEYVTVYANEQGGNYQPKLVITYRNQSKIKNTGQTNFKGYLLIQVQYNNSGTWVLDNTTVNETFPRTINISGQLALDRIFNGRIRASDLKHGTGTYRVYTAFRDPTGAILKTETVSGGGWLVRLS